MIVVRNEKGFLQRIDIGEHTLLADLPKEMGGEGSAPEPHDLFDAALGACKALTVSLFAKQKELPLKGIDVRVIRDAKDEKKGTYRLTTELTLEGPLDEEQRKLLLSVAEKCPIHKLMTTTDVEIETLLTE